MGDDTVALVGEEEHLVLEIVAIEGPTVREGHDWAGGAAPVFIVDLS